MDLYNKSVLPVAIIGMGAAGAMAGIASDPSIPTTIFDGNEKLGKKIYITGKGRCNLTNTAPMAAFLKQVTRNPKFLYSAFNAFDNRDLMNFFEEQGVPLKEERGGRVFPKSDHASDINKALEKRLKAQGVVLKKKCRLLSLYPGAEEGPFVLEFDEEGRRKTVYAHKVILATGGLSYPSTGSRGEGQAMAEKLSHTITKMTPSLVAFKLQAPWLRPLRGLSLRNVTLKVKLGKKTWSEFGEALFTETGLSGPIVLTLSSLISGKNLDGLLLSLDFKPAMDEKALATRLQREREAGSNRSIKTLFQAFLPKSLVPIFLEEGGMDPNKPFHQMTQEEEKRFIGLLKDFPLPFDGLEGFSQAVITRGGVSIKEINPSTMESKKVPGLYFAGEIMDVDAMTGGYNLQIAFSTGYLAGQSASRAFLDERQEES